MLYTNGNQIEFEIGTGSGKSVLSEKVYHERLKEVPLEDTKINLRTYSGENLKY